MKKLFSILCIIVLFAVQSVNAAETVSFKVDCTECQKGRLVDIAINACSPRALSAATFSFSYNKSILAFRKGFALGESQIEYRETDEGVMLCYLNSHGAETDNISPIFTLTFYACAEGESNINFRVDGCTDSSAQFIDVGNCTAGKVTVIGSGAQSSKTGASRSGSSAGADSSGGSSSGKSENAANVANEKTTAAVNDIGTVNDVISRDSDKFTPIIFLAVSAVIAAALAGFLIFKKTSAGKHDD